MSDLRLALALPHLGVFGGIRRFLELGEVWARRGHEVAIFVPDTGNAHAWLPFSGAILPLAELPRGSWDVVITPDPGLFHEARCPGALRVYYSVLEKAPNEDRALRAADLVLANSASMRRYLSRKGIEAADAAGGVNLSRFHPAPTRTSEDSEPLRALVYGRVSRKRKGTWVAVRAIERAAIASRVPVTVTLFDAAPQGEAFALPRPLRVPHRWVLNPTQSELAELYRTSDFFVSAERRAGWCNTAAEAMASGCAVVCTRSGTEDFAIDGITAAVTPWRWSWAIASVLRPLLNDPGRRNLLAARGLERIQDYSWERTADRIDRALEARRGGSTCASASSSGRSA
jgi:glycosyltransferase involved in cell wall biosynthesis